jgi:hypothetical protein
MEISSLTSTNQTIDETILLDTAPKTGTAGYCSLGTQKLVDELCKKLGEKVEIRNRTGVFSSPRKMLQADGWKEFPWENAKEKDIWIWCREMLEPTISALSPTPA